MINWLGLLGVMGTTIGVSLLSICLVAFGIRLLATPPATDTVAGDARDEEEDDVIDEGRPTWATVFAFLCFGGFAAVVLYGIYLIVPYFG